MTDIDTTRTPRPRSGPLAGIRVADFCWMGVGAMATRTLADMGAQVIKIEHASRLDLPRRTPIYKGEPARAFGQEEMGPDPNRSGYFNNFNRNKLGVTIDMRQPRGRALAERLIATSSVVSENFAPGVMERWGLTYDRLREIRPDVIFARMSGFGHSGPDSGYRSYGPVVQAVCGMSYVSGLPGREPSGWGLSYMDSQGGYYNAAALLAAIYHRNRTGQGTLIEVSAVEIGITLLGPLMLEVTANGRRTRGEAFPTGNRLEHPDAAPHGVYPCVGEDRWIALSVFDEAQWQGFVKATGHAAWTADPRFADQRGRHACQDPLDEHVATWTRGFEADELMDLLQSHGVAAGVVRDARELTAANPALARHSPFFELDHPVAGRALFEGMPAQMSGFEPDNWRSSPMLGEDNDYVFKELLGMEDAEYHELREAGVF